MKFMIFLFTFVAAATVHATPVEGILGNWKTEQNILDRGVQYQLGFDFNENKATLHVRCFFYDGATLEAQASAFATYEANNIFINENRQSVVDDGFHFCRATLQPTRWTAYFDGTGKMVLFVPVPYQTRLTLVPSDI